VKISFITPGTITTPHGFRAGAANAGIKKKDNKPELGIISSDISCNAAGIFTTNRVKAAPVLLCQQRLQKGTARAIVANSCCANACTGERGMVDAAGMAEMAAEVAGVSSDDVLVASTGVIGLPMPMECFKAGIKKIALTSDGGGDFARAIMTTDTVPKEAAIRVSDEGCEFTIGGVAKGSGMIHPNMATMLCFLTTDAVVETGFLKDALRQAADISFNMVSIDGDTSTNDMMLIMANGRAGNEPVTADSRYAEAFQQALNDICIYLAKFIARDGEGATRLIEVTVNGALAVSDARAAARTIVNSPLVKTAVHGSDPNWGRVIAALGRSGVEMEEAKVHLFLGGYCLAKGGQPVPFDMDGVVAALKESDVHVRVELNLGDASATAWGCDLSAEYVAINSEYTT